MVLCGLRREMEAKGHPQIQRFRVMVAGEKAELHRAMIPASDRGRVYASGVMEAWLCGQRKHNVHCIQVTN